MKESIIDFSSGKNTYRRLQGGGMGQPIAKALGIKKYPIPPTILDATAGLLQDSFVLACLGCTVIAIERHQKIAAHLKAALEHARHDPELAPIVERITLIQGDALQLLPSLTATHNIDIIYLDPMFPHRTKSALVKKELRWLREHVGDDLDADALLTCAQPLAPKIVVKRPKVAPVLAGIKPTRQWIGERNRFDIYHKV